MVRNQARSVFLSLLRDKRRSKALTSFSCGKIRWKAKGETKSDQKETTGSAVPFQAETCQAGELSNVSFNF